MNMLCTADQHPRSRIFPKKFKDIRFVFLPIYQTLSFDLRISPLVVQKRKVQNNAPRWVLLTQLTGNGRSQNLR